ncbi:glycosyltransferase family 1 protein [Exiguobacterium sp. s189]|uniref:glycosyltransferase family 1 protein n=1 Tax=Exiguobacterium sp. s189 TaxID=2751263 RepID=UPI001BE662C2|nr:glycosyltransferase family 1 protein [Exiguobacterium sp. s189]
MNKKIKVLHVIGLRPQGGVGTFLYNITKYIDHSLFHFDFLFNSNELNGEFDSEVKKYGSNVYVLPELKYKNTLMYLKELSEFYKKNNEYDIIHIHSPNIALFNYVFAKKINKVSFAVHSHSTKYSDKYINSIRNLILNFPVNSITDIKLACSESAAQFMFGRKALENKLTHILPNAIESDRYKYNPFIRNDVRKELGIDEQLVIGHVGSFLSVKNHDFLIDVFLEVKKIKKNSLLVLVGEGETKSRIIEKVKHLNLTDSVKFLGQRADVNNLMQAFDIFVMPSKFEGVPLVGVEAQASGLPCVFSNTITKDIKILDKVEFVCLSEDTQVWAKKIISNSEYPRNVESKMIENAGYDINVLKNKLEQVYSQYKLK